MFVIVKDHLVENGITESKDSEVGRHTPDVEDSIPELKVIKLENGKLSDEIMKEIKKFMPYRFLLKSDDGDKDLEGYSDTNDDDNAFLPLDWAQGWVGSTEIYYKENGKWVIL